MDERSFLSVVQVARLLCEEVLHGEPSGMKSQMCFLSFPDSSNGRAAVKSSQLTLLGAHNPRQELR